MKNKYEVRGDIIAIVIKRYDGTILEAIIDTDDLEKVMNFQGSWCANYERKNDTFYVRGNLRNGQKRTTVSLHSWLMNTPPGYVVDHINHNGLDNRRSENLRIVTVSENQMNRRARGKNNTSGYRGVHWNVQRNKWQASLKYQGKRKYFGFYDDINKANEAVINGRKKYFGDKSQEAYKNS